MGHLKRSRVNEIIDQEVDEIHIYTYYVTPQLYAVCPPPLMQYLSPILSCLPHLFIYCLSPPHIMSVPLLSYLFSPFMLHFPTLVYCQSLPCILSDPSPSRIQIDASRDYPTLLLSHFTNLIANKYVSQCLSVLLPGSEKLGTHVRTHVPMEKARC